MELPSEAAPVSRASANAWLPGLDRPRLGYGFWCRCWFTAFLMIFPIAPAHRFYRERRLRRQ